MLLKWLDTIRTKPKHVRLTVAFWGAMISTGLVAGMWTISLPTKLNDFSEHVNGQSQSASAPFSGIWNQVVGQFRDVRQAIELLPEDIPDTLENENTFNLEQILLDSRNPDTYREQSPVQTPQAILIATSSATTSATSVVAE